MKKKLLTIMLVIVSLVALVAMVACSGVEEDTWKDYGFSTALDVDSVEAKLSSAQVTEAGSIAYSWTEATEAGFDTVVAWLQQQGFDSIGDTDVTASKGAEYYVYSAVKSVAVDADAALAAEEDTATTKEVLAHLIYAVVDVTIDEVAYTAGTMTLYVGLEDAADAPEYVEPHVHTEETIPAVPATCTTTGLTAGTKCSVCGQVLVAPTTVPALGHDYQSVAGTAVQATCTTDGKAADTKCSRCDSVVAGATIAGGHTLEGNYCSVCEKTFVAKISAKECYETLAEAVEAANNDTITVLTNVTLTEGITIVTDQNITLDLNGYVVSYESTLTTGNAAITNNGTLTVMDSSANSTGKITYLSTAPSANNGYGTNTILNAGTLTLNSGTIENTTNGGSSCAIDTSWNTNVTIVINGGKVTSIKNSIRLVGSSATTTNSLVVNAGEISGTRAIMIHIPGSGADIAPIINVDINGGQFIGTDDGQGYVLAMYSWSENTSTSKSFNNVNIDISAGTFAGDIALRGGGKNGAETLNISGGIFTDVYAYGEATDKITVTAGTFTNIANAVAYAADNAVIKLAADVTATSTITIANKTLTIDFAGHNYVMDATGSGNVFFLDDGANVTFANTSATTSYVKQNVASHLLVVDAGATATINANVVLEQYTANAVVFVGESTETTSSVATLNVYGSIIHKGEKGDSTDTRYFAICGNGNDVTGGTLINIYDGAVVKSNKLAIYHPQFGTLNMTGGLVEGYAGIDAKAGTINIVGGTVRGTANDKDIVNYYSSMSSYINANNATVDGSAIVIESHSAYAGGIRLTISGDAVIESLYSVAVVEFGQTSVNNITSIDILGGTLKSGTDVTSVLVRDVAKHAVVITAGTFTADPTAYVDTEDYTVNYAENVYTVVAK